MASFRVSQPFSYSALDIFLLEDFEARPAIKTELKRADKALEGLN